MDHIQTPHLSSSILQYFQRRAGSMLGLRGETDRFKQQKAKRKKSEEEMNGKARTPERQDKGEARPFNNPAEH